MDIYEKISNDIAQPYYQEKYSNNGQRFISWYLRNIYSLNVIEAGACITDGPGDKQIDAIYVDHQQQTVFIIQGKFYNSPTVDAESSCCISG